MPATKKRKKKLTAEDLQRRGGYARAESLSQRQRTQIAQKAARARWSKVGRKKAAGAMHARKQKKA